MSDHSSSTKSILYAFLANFGIAIIKSISAAITGSGAMLAEAIHSFADCGNQGLLFLGLKRAKRPPTPDFPLGYGKEIFFWSFIVAIILFSMGGLFSLYEGIHKLDSIEPISYPGAAIIVLIISIGMEGASLFGCLREIKKIRRNNSLLHWIKSTRRSELLVVLAEDTAAILGLLFALIAIIISIITGNPFFDALGSMGIGVLLIIISLFVGIKIKDLLIGQSVENEKREKILSLLENSLEIETVFNLITLQLGDGIMTAVKVKMAPADNVDKLISNINTCEKRLKENFPDIRWVFFEPDVRD